MRRSLAFVGLGSLAALLCEFSFKFFVTHDYGGFLFVLIFYPVYAALLCRLYCLLESHSKPRAVFIVVYLISGLAGLAIEWFVIGNSPWRNPDASQLGMWSFWTAIAALPMIYLRDSRLARMLIRAFVFGYFGISVILWLILPRPMLALLIVWEVVFYTALQAVYAWYVVRRLALVQV